MNEKIEHMITVEKARLNIWNVGGLIVAIIMNVITATALYVNLSRDVANAASKTDVSELQLKATATDENFRQIGTRIELVRRDLDNIPYRTGQLEAQMIETAKRTDRVVEMFGGKLDTINESVQKLSTRVEVLTSKISYQKDTLLNTPEPKKETLQ